MSNNTFCISVDFLPKWESCNMLMQCYMATSLSDWDCLICQMEKQLDWKRRQNLQGCKYILAFFWKKYIGNLVVKFFWPTQLLLLINNVVISKQLTYGLCCQLYRINRCTTELWSHINRLFPLAAQRPAKCHSLVLNIFSWQMSQLFPLSR